MRQCNFWIVIKKKRERERETVLNFWQFFFGEKNPKLLEPAPYTGVGDDSDDNYEDCDWGGDDFDDNDGAVAGADWKPAMANLTKSSHFSFLFNFVSNQLQNCPKTGGLRGKRHNVTGQSAPGWWWRCHDHCD